MTVPAQTAEALRAYVHAGAAPKAVRHRVDLVDERLVDYGAPRRTPLAPVYSAEPTSRRIEHEFARPTATAFKAGFGFAAGAALFRLIAAFWALVFILLLASIAYSQLG